MSELKPKWGYCPNCVKNIPHYCVTSSRLYRVLDALSFGYAQSFRIGPWYCVHCETRSVYLKEEKEDALRYRSTDTESTSRSDSEEARDDEVAQPVGNFLKSDQSLVMRSTRLKRFTEKYRDSIVRRLLSGTSTSQIRQEKDITEGELTDWIADLFDRMQVRLDALENTIGSLPTVRLVNEDPENSRTDSIPFAPTVEGRTKPR